MNDGTVQLSTASDILLKLDAILGLKVDKSIITATDMMVMCSGTQMYAINFFPHHCKGYFQFEDDKRHLARIFRQGQTVIITWKHENQL